jgi:hypothetical protein
MKNTVFWDVATDVSEKHRSTRLPDYWVSRPSAAQYSNRYKNLKSNRLFGGTSVNFVSRPSVAQYSNRYKNLKPKNLKLT